MQSALIATLIAASVTIIGWVTTNYFAKKREDEARKSQAALRHLERQIEELYGPLEGLLTYSNIVFQLEQTRKKLRPPDQADKDTMVIQYFIENHYIPNNLQIITLLRTKAYLMVGNSTPESFVQFMSHAANLECLHNLWLKTKLDSFFMPVPDHNWPELFHNDVSRTLQDLRNRYAEVIHDMTGNNLRK